MGSTCARLLCLSVQCSDQGRQRRQRHGHWGTARRSSARTRGREDFIYVKEGRASTLDSFPGGACIAGRKDAPGTSAISQPSPIRRSCALRPARLPRGAHRRGRSRARAAWPQSGVKVPSSPPCPVPTVRSPAPTWAALQCPSLWSVLACHARHAVGRRSRWFTRLGVIHTCPDPARRRESVSPTNRAEVVTSPHGVGSARFGGTKMPPEELGDDRAHVGPAPR